MFFAVMAIVIMIFISFEIANLLTDEYIL